MKKILFLSIAALLLAGGCGQKEDNGETPETPETPGTSGNAQLSATPATIQATVAAGTYTLNVTSVQAWSAEVNAAATWCAISPNFYAGNYATKVNVLENPLALQRAATITFTSGMLTCKATVAQAAAAATLSVDKWEIPASVAAGSYTIAVTSNAAWTATVNSGATWCSVAAASGTGNGTLTVNVAANPTTAPRAATVTITAGTATGKVTVTQEALTLSVNKTGIPANATANSYTFTVTSNSTWMASVNSGATWCTVSPASATGNGTVTVTAAENTAETARTATVTVTAGTLSKNVTVSQAGKPDTPPPPHAASTKTWTFGNQIWSDAIRIPECNKTSFTASSDVPHCRSYTYNTITHYYYNWAYMNTNKNIMCPAPWRVPTRYYFDDLIASTSAEELFTKWGPTGLFWYESTWHQVYFSQAEYACLWTISGANSTSSFMFVLGWPGGVGVHSRWDGNAATVRCVRTP
jgi:hypothetical protein